MSSKTEESSSRSVLRAFQHARISTKITAVYAVILFILLTVGIGAMAFGVYYAFYHQAEVAIGISERRTVEKLEGGADFTPNFWNDDPVLPGVVLRVTDITGRVVFENDAHFPSLADIDAHTRTRPPFWADQGMAVADVGNSTIYHATVDVMHGGSIYTLHFLRTITAESSAEMCTPKADEKPKNTMKSSTSWGMMRTISR